MPTTKQRVDRLELKMMELAEAQMQTQVVLNTLSDAQARTEASLKTLSEEMQKFRDDMKTSREEMYVKWAIEQLNQQIAKETDESQSR